MYKSAIRAAPRRILPSRTLLQNTTSRRFLSTAPPTKKSRSWKSSAARWGLAIGGIYYYNTSNVFAEEPEGAIQRLDESIHHVQESNQPTIDAIVEEKRQREAQRIAEENKREMAAKAVLAGEEEAAGEEDGEDGLEGLEEEAGQQGAFNEETGEINWDCPCLGGMAHGPCGEEFKEAFSCFVYSKEEPKGVECIEKFKGMQDCFRQHPEMYASELEDDEDEVEEELRAREAVPAGEQTTVPSSKSTKVAEPSQSTAIPAAEESKPVEQAHQDRSSTTVENTQKAGDEGEELLPKGVHDARSK